MKQYTETQIRQKIILYISSRTNHKKVLKIEKDNPPVKIDTGINAPIYFKGKNLSKIPVRSF